MREIEIVAWSFCFNIGVFAAPSIIERDNTTLSLMKIMENNLITNESEGNTTIGRRHHDNRTLGLKNNIDNLKESYSTSNQEPITTQIQEKNQNTTIQKKEQTTSVQQENFTTSNFETTNFVETTQKTVSQTEAAQQTPQNSPTIGTSNKEQTSQAIEFTFPTTENHSKEVENNKTTLQGMNSSIPLTIRFESNSSSHKYIIFLVMGVILVGGAYFLCQNKQKVRVWLGYNDGHPPNSWAKYRKLPTWDDNDGDEVLLSSKMK